MTVEARPDAVYVSARIDGDLALAPKSTPCRGLGSPQIIAGAEYAVGGQLDIDDLVLTAVH